MTGQLWWYVARAGGIVGWFLLATSVLWGLAISTKATAGKVRPNWMLDLHRFLGGLAVVFVGVHLVGLVADSYFYFGPAQLLVPFTSSYRPGAVAWGVVAMYALIAVEATSLARRHLPRKLWRMTHALSFPLFVFSTVHTLTAGTDTTDAWLRVTMVVACIAVAVLTVVRIAGLAGGAGRPRRTLPVRSNAA
ncbi:MAG: ferric reductase-like transmembrane domain-containing protein [Ilumatobacteraceae bacterium]